MIQTFLFYLRNQRKEEKKKKTSAFLPEFLGDKISLDSAMSISED